MDEQYVNPSFSVRLAGGMNSREGTLQLFHNGVWGTVCTDAYRDDDLAGEVCSTLGFGYVLWRFINKSL